MMCNLSSNRRYNPHWLLNNFLMNSFNIFCLTRPLEIASYRIFTNNYKDYCSIFVDCILLNYILYYPSLMMNWSHIIFYLYQLQNLTNPYQIYSGFIVWMQGWSLMHCWYAPLLVSAYYVMPFVYCLLKLVIRLNAMDHYCFIRILKYSFLISLFYLSCSTAASFEIIEFFCP